MSDVDGLVRHHLDILSVKNAVLLLSHHIIDSGLACVEVISHLLHGVGTRSLLHDRFSLDYSGTVSRTTGIESGGRKVIFHVVGGQFHVSVCDADITIIVYDSFSVTEVFYDGIFCLSEGRNFKGRLSEHVDGVSGCN